MKSSDFKTRLKLALQLRNMRQVELANKSGIDKSVISCYLSGKYEAKQDFLQILADALQVNPVWLMGYDVDIDCPYEVITEKEFDEAAVNALYKEILMKTSSIDDNTKLKSLLKGLINKLEDFINNLK